MLEVTAKYRQQIYRKNTQRVPESMASRLLLCVVGFSFLYVFKTRPFA